MLAILEFNCIRLFSFYAPLYAVVYQTYQPFYTLYLCLTNAKVLRALSTAVYSRLGLFSLIPASFFLTINLFLFILFQHTLHWSLCITPKSILFGFLFFLPTEYQCLLINLPDNTYNASVLFLVAVVIFRSCHEVIDLILGLK